MPTNRTPRKRRRSGGGGGPFTPEVIATFRRLLQLEDDDPEYRNVCKRLDALLGFDEPWTRFSPAYVQADSVPPTRVRAHERPDWDRAIKVRRELEQAAAESD